MHVEEIKLKYFFKEFLSTENDFEGVFVCFHEKIHFVSKSYAENLFSQKLSRNMEFLMSFFP